MKFKSRRTKGRKQDPLQFERLEDRQLLAAVLTVNSTLDSNVRDNFLTFREAILVNNRTLAVSTLSTAEQVQVSGTPTSTDTDTIGFNIPSAGVQSITPTTALPSISDPAVIDGYTQPGASANTLVVGSDAVLRIEIAGSVVGNALVIAANNTTVRGLVIHSFGSAIYVQSGGNTIEGNWLGIDDDGNTRLANTYDVFITNPASSENNLIGGTTPGSRNVMAGTSNQNAGIMLFPGGGSATIQGNYIGMNAQGTDGIGASGRIYLGTPGNLVGGTAPGAGNVISGRAMEVYSSGNIVQGNTFGLNASGTGVLANNLNGIFIAAHSAPTDNNLVGGTTPEARNVFATLGTAMDIANSSGVNVGNRIQGNFFGTNKAGTAAAGVMNPNGSGAAIQISGGMNNVIGGTDSGAGNVIANYNYGMVVNGSNNTIQGNRIGTNAAGTAAIPNGSGIYVNAYVSNTLIGGSTTGAPNVISGNQGNGILIAAGGTFNTIQGNLVGVAADGVSPLGNGSAGGNPVLRNGIRVEGSDNRIGGTSPGEGNTVAFNFGSGVLLPLTNVLPNQGLRNAVQGNSIYSNGGLGIDIYGGGVTVNDLNDTDSGPNNVQNFPVLGSALTFGASTTIQGTLNSIANSTFLIDFYSNPTADPTGFGEGQTYLGSSTVTTDGSGNGSFSFNSAVAVPVGHFISSTATGAAGNTSEFSGVRTVTTPPTLSINDVSATEGLSGITAFTFTVTLSANPSSNVTVTVNTADGTTNPAITADNDYSAINNLMLTFVPNGPLTQTVTVNVNGDAKFERDETFFVNLSSPTGATIADGQGLGTIQNDDLAPTMSFSTNNSVLEGNVTADDRKVPFTITLSAVSGVDVTGTINTSSGTATEGTDFVSADGVAFVIPAGQTQATILVSVIEDTEIEADEQFTISATAADPSTVSNSTASGVGTLRNDDFLSGEPASIGPGCHGPALIINGTEAGDKIRVVPLGKHAVKVLINGLSYGPFAISSFVEIQVYGKNGDDDIELAADLDMPAFLFGEAGNDRLKGGNGANMLVGGNGDDDLIGSQAADVLIGGDGSDRLVGNGGDDLMIAGWTDHDTSLAALCTILDEWSRTDVSYETRVNHLQVGGGLNDSVLLNSLTVHDDGDFDKLTGSAGRDWFFANIDFGVLDEITDQHPAELVDDID